MAAQQQYQSVSSTKYPECNHIPREQPHPLVSEDQMRAFLLEADVLPLFEERMQDFRRMKHYSMTTNKLLYCRWRGFIRSLDDPAKTHYKAPNVEAFHFHNYLIKYQPIDKASICHRYTMKCGPGVDKYGQQIPIPDDRHNYRAGVSKPYAAAARQRHHERNPHKLGHAKPPIHDLRPKDGRDGPKKHFKV